MEIELGTKAEREGRVIQLVYDVDEEQVWRLSGGNVFHQLLVHWPEPVGGSGDDTRRICEGHDVARHPACAIARVAALAADGKVAYEW